MLPGKDRRQFALDQLSKVYPTLTAQQRDRASKIFAEQFEPDLSPDITERRSPTGSGTGVRAVDYLRFIAVVQTGENTPPGISEDEWGIIVRKCLTY